MTKITLNNVADLTQATSAAVTINSNSNTIETAFDNTLSRDGTTPNSMRANIDMDSNRILNLPAPVALSEPLRLTDANTLNGGGTIATVPAGGAAGTVLAKTSSSDYAMGWVNDSSLVSAGSNISTSGTNPVTIGVISSPTFAGMTATNPVINGEVTGTAVSTIASANTLVKRDGSGAILGLPFGYTTTATAAGTTTLTVTSSYDQFFTGTNTQTVTMPVTSTLALGNAWKITNNSTGAVTVQSSGANTITVVPAGGRALITCILTSGTTASSWDVTTDYEVTASGKKMTFNNTLALSGTDGTTMTFPTTSATLARTDAANTFTGTQTVGALVATTVNGNTITTGTGTLALGAGKTATVNNTLTLSGTDGSTLAIGPGGTLTGSSSAAVFYDNIPQNSQSASYNLILSDANKHILHPAGDNNPRTFTIPANASVAYPIGTAITFVNQINTLTISITSDTLTLAGAGTTGSRTLAANGIATALKLSSTGWIISGTGLT